MTIYQKLTVLVAFVAITAPVGYTYGIPAAVATAGGIIWLDLTLERIKR